MLPSVTIKLASRPGFNEPIKEERPQISAGTVVRALNALRSDRPCSIAIRTLDKKSFRFFSPWAVKATSIERLANTEGFEGARSQWRSWASETSRSSLTDSRRGGSGKSTGAIIVAPIDLS